MLVGLRIIMSKNLSLNYKSKISKYYYEGECIIHFHISEKGFSVYYSIF